MLPLIVRAVPGTAMAGLKLVIVGAVVDRPTVNELALEVDPEGVVSPRVPVVAPEGTVTCKCVAVAARTTADVPLNLTTFWLAVMLKPVPQMLTAVPGKPALGENSVRVT